MTSQSRQPGAVPSANRVVIAPDKFRGSLTAAQAAEIIAEAVQQADPSLEPVLRPVADGGEGTVEAAIAAGAQAHQETVSGPQGELVTATWAMLPGRIAVIECAQASGIDLTTPSPAHAVSATSLGTGQLIAAALRHDPQELVIGLGGSAMTDGGVGALQGLGVQIRDETGREVGPGATGAGQAAQLDLGGLATQVGQIPVRFASDVTNPLLGPVGTAPIFGPQKGATTSASQEQLVSALTRWAAVLAPLGCDPTAVGSGAAGGLAFGLSVVFPQAVMTRGFDLVADLIGLDDVLQGARAAITGEGSMDAQTLAGKAPIGVIDRAAAFAVPSYLIAGRVSVRTELLARGVRQVIALNEMAANDNESMAKAPELLHRAARALHL